MKIGEVTAQGYTEEKDGGTQKQEAWEVDGESKGGRERSKELIREDWTNW